MSNGAKRRGEAVRGPDAGERGFRFGPVNFALMAAAGVAIVLGYVLLDGGSVTAAPLLLVLGYAILLPAGLLMGWRRLGSEDPRRSDRDASGRRPPRETTPRPR